MKTKQEKKDKIKQLVKNICKKNSDFIDNENITFKEIIEIIGKFQEPYFKFKDIK